MNSPLFSQQTSFSVILPLTRILDANNSGSVKREEEDDDALLLADFEPASLQYMPNMMNGDNGDDNSLKNEIELNDPFMKTGLDAKETKKRAPRKRLTPFQKQAHNKIEKRYRININTKIARLQQIIPWVASEQTCFRSGWFRKEAGWRR